MPLASSDVATSAALRFEDLWDFPPEPLLWCFALCFCGFEPSEADFLVLLDEFAALTVTSSETAAKHTRMRARDFMLVVESVSYFWFLHGNVCLHELALAEVHRGRRQPSTVSTPLELGENMILRLELQTSNKLKCVAPNHELWKYSQKIAVHRTALRTASEIRCKGASRFFFSSLADAPRSAMFSAGQQGRKGSGKKTRADILAEARAVRESRQTDRRLEKHATKIASAWRGR